MKKIIYPLIGLLVIAAAVVLIVCKPNSDDPKEDRLELSSDIVAVEKQYADTKKDNLKWEYNEATKTIVISGEGAMQNYNDLEPEWYHLNNEAEKLVIGDKVTSIGDSAFSYFSQLSEVKLGASVEYIGFGAFDNCMNLRTVNFPGSLKYIGDYAFNNDLLHSDNGFVLPNGILYLGKSSFRSAFKESFVSIPASLATIEYNAFDNCFVEEFRVDEANQNYKSQDGIFYDKNATTLINYPAAKNSNSKLFEIPSTVTTIKKEAIVATNDLEKIVIPKSVATIEEGAIFWNYGLKYIDVSQDNANYQSIDGVLYTKDGKHLISYPIASERDEYTTLDTTEDIQTYAISQANNLKKLHIKEGVKSLNEGAIYLCKNLEEIDLPKSLQQISEYALEFNDNLKLIKYASTKSNWSNIKVEDNNTTLQSPHVKIDFASLDNK